MNANELQQLYDSIRADIENSALSKLQRTYLVSETHKQFRAKITPEEYIVWKKSFKPIKKKPLYINYALGFVPMQA